MLTTWRTQVFAPFQARSLAGIPEAGQIPATALALPTFRLPGHPQVDRPAAIH